MQAPPASIVAEALLLHRSGNLAEAARLYTEALAQAPQNPDALFYLAMIHCHHGQFNQGIDLLRKAISTAPRRASAHNLLGMAHHRLGQFDAALASFDIAISCEPGLTDAHGNRAAVLLDLRRYAEAVESCDRALTLMPDSVTDWCTRGAALGEMARHEDAIASYDQALARDPRLAAAHFNRGQCLGKVKRYTEALSAYAKVLSINPRMVEALHEQGNVLRQLGRLEEALASYDQAVTLSPTYAEAFNKRGNILCELKRFEEALASYDHAIALKPTYAEAFHNRGVALGALMRLEDSLASYDRAIALRADRAEFVYGRARVLSDLKRLDEALVCYGRAIALNPIYAEALYYRGHALSELKRFEEAIASYDQAIALNLDLKKHFPGAQLHAKMHLCDWIDFDRDCSRLISVIEKGDCAGNPFIFLTIPSTPEQQLKSAKLYVGASCRASAEPLWRGERYAHERIRIGYLSSDMRNHAVGVLTAGLFEHHDKSRFETIALSVGPDEDRDIRRRMKSAFDQFYDLRLHSDAKVAELIRKLEIDIAVDLNGFTQGARLNVLARRPAPVQVNYLGYVSTMGAGYIDYILADRIVIPPDQHQFYSEKVVYLPDCYQVNDDKRRISDITPSRMQVGLPEHGFVFCSFNNSYKITPFMFDIWMRLLRHVKGSVLWLVGDIRSTERNIRREAEQRGVAAHRIVFGPRVAYADYLARYRAADLFLDTMPYNGGTTVSDALWAGLPVVTCGGEAFAGRMASSLLSAAGLPELVTQSLPDYEQLALALATDKTQLASIRAKLANNRTTCSLFDSGRFTRHIEAAYTTMWEIQQGGDPPRSFAVPVSDRQVPITSS